MSSRNQYIAIDLKSFYASVECMERGLDPLDTCLVVADRTRTEKTICLAVSPALKKYGIPGRPRLFEVMQKINDINLYRGNNGKSVSGLVLEKNNDVKVDYIVAPPRMQLYVDYSARIFDIYLKFVSSEDIHVYSIDEVFINASPYLSTYKVSAHELAMMMIREVLKETGVTATAGIGTNLYLAKIAMDIVAKKMPPDKDGVRIAELDEISYRRKLWNHKPLTDFWRIGKGIAKKLEKGGMFTMGEVARNSLYIEDWFYFQFGVNAELIIDHAWGWEPVTMDVVKAYRPSTHSLSSGQVLPSPYSNEKAGNVIKEMAENIALELVEKKLMTNQVVLTIGYDVENLKDPFLSGQYDEKISIDRYGRKVPYHAHGTSNIDYFTSSSKLLIETTSSLFKKITNPKLLIRRITLSVNKVLPENEIYKHQDAVQLNLFSDYDFKEMGNKEQKEMQKRERSYQEAIINIRKKFGKNVILSGINFNEGATQRTRNNLIGGHKA